LICRSLSAQQLARLTQEVSRTETLSEKSKVFWVRIFAKWLTVRMDLDDFEKLTDKQKVALRRAANDRRRADPSAAVKAS
jgi:hypothetical protein